MLNELKEILKSLDETTGVVNAGVYYGMCNRKDLDEWNYIVFNRKDTGKSGKTAAVGFSEYFEVHIVHEDYIPEGYVYDVIREVQKKSGQAGCKLRLTDDRIAYTYTQKPNTDIVMEIATITFVHAMKDDVIRE